MNDRKLNQLFNSARNEPPVSPPAGFDARVLSAIRRGRPAASEPVSIFDALNAWFPRLAWAAVTIIALCVAADYGLTATGLPGLGDGVSQVSAHWLLWPNGFGL